MKTQHSAADLKKLKQKSVNRKTRKPVVAYSNYIYKLKKVSLAVTDTVMVPGWLRTELCSDVGTEAARLAKLNGRGTITQREVCSAVRTLQMVTQRTTGTQ